jgi:hypothetical protein
MRAELDQAAFLRREDIMKRRGLARVAWAGDIFSQSSSLRRGAIGDIFFLSSSLFDVDLPSRLVSDLFLLPYNCPFYLSLVSRLLVFLIVHRYNSKLIL